MPRRRTGPLCAAALAAVLAGHPAIPATFSDARPGDDRSALEAMIGRPEVSGSLSPFDRADLAQAIVLLAKGAYEEAARLAERVTESAPDAGEGWHILGLARANAEDYPGALAALERASDAFAANATPDVVRGDLLAFLDRQEDARAAYRAAIARDPDIWPAHVGLAELALAAGDTEAAIGHLQAAVERAPDDEIAPARRLTQVLVQAGRARQAAATLADAAQRGQDPAIWRELARIHAAAGAPGKAAEALARARDLAPGDADLLVDSAELARATGDPDAAAGYLEDALAAQPDDPAIAATLARVRIEAGQPERAFDALDHWRESPETAPEPVLLALAVSNAAAGNLDTAAQLHETRTRRFPSPDAFADRAGFLIAAGETAAASALLTDAVARFPGMATLRLQLARARAAQGDIDAADAVLRAGLSVLPDDPALLRSASRVALRRGDTGRARDLAARLTKARTAGPDDLVWLGFVEETRGDVPAARAAYRAALDGDADNVVALNNLASVLAEDAPAEAVSLARRAVAVAGPQPQLLATLGWALYHDGALQEARESLLAASRDRPDDATTLYRLGLTHLALGEDAAGRAALRQALESDAGFDGAETARKHLRQD